MILAYFHFRQYIDHINDDRFYFNQFRKTGPFLKHLALALYVYGS